MWYLWGCSGKAIVDCLSLWDLQLWHLRGCSGVVIFWLLIINTGLKLVAHRIELIGFHWNFQMWYFFRCSGKGIVGCLSLWICNCFIWEVVHHLNISIVSLWLLIGIRWKFHTWYLGVCLRKENSKGVVHLLYFVIVICWKGCSENRR